MRKFVLSELILLSTKEKKAKKVQFDQKRTLILGGNGTGKSCLLKSIYKTFGAEPYTDHPSWKHLDPISFVRFSIENASYSILKDGRVFAIFNDQDELINVFHSVTKELGPFLANLLDFKIKLADSKGSFITPPPAFLFLPYYIDQDISWQKNWSSFSKLQQIKKFREPIVSYHTGLKPNDYYQTKGELEKYITQMKELEDERKILSNILNKLKGKIRQVDFNLDIEKFKEDVKNLLVECEILRNNQEELKTKLVDLYNYKISVESQLVIAKNALNESRKDYKYATEIIVDDHVDCPTCGAHYENSFAERFEIAMDEDRCKELIVELDRELNSINEKIVKENSIYNKNNEEILKIESILENSKGEIKLRDLIENAGRNELKSVFEENTKSIVSEIRENFYKQKALQDKLKAIIDKERRKRIMDLYLKFMKKFLYELDVNTLKEINYHKIDAKIPETGSALPRALIAYYFSIFKVMQEYTSSVFCPIIIDSPNQQGQDEIHMDKILKFINDNQPIDSQMILGLEELYNIDFNCKIIELNDKLSLLQKDDYEALSQEIDYYQNKIWNNKRDYELF